MRCAPFSNLFVVVRNRLIVMDCLRRDLNEVERPVPAVLGGVLHWLRGYVGVVHVGVPSGTAALPGWWPPGFLRRPHLALPPVGPGGYVVPAGPLEGVPARVRSPEDAGLASPTAYATPAHGRPPARPSALQSRGAPPG